MIISHTFICDLRQKEDSWSGSFNLAAILSSSMWEFALFEACQHCEAECVFQWHLYCISSSSDLFRIMPMGDFSFCDLKCSLDSLNSLSFHEFVKIDTQGDPLIKAIELCSFLDDDYIYLFVSSEWGSIGENHNGIKNLNSGSKGLMIIQIGENPDCLNDIPPEIGRIVLSLTNDSIFSFFRSVASNTAQKSIKIIMVLGNQEIVCNRHQILNDSVDIQTVKVCNCHQKPIKTRNHSEMCQVRNKTPKGVSLKRGLNGMILPMRDSNDDKKNLWKVHYRFPQNSVSETILYGIVSILTSSSPIFFRLVNEMRARKEVILIENTSSNTFGGEFCILTADNKMNIIHSKHISNRTQIIRLSCESIIENSKSISYTPVLQEIPLREELSPFYLGKKWLENSFVKKGCESNM